MGASSNKLLENKIAQKSLRRQIYRKNLRANVETKDMLEDRRWEYVAHLGGELDRYNKTQSGSPSLTLAGSWTASIKTEAESPSLTVAGSWAADHKKWKILL